MTETEVQPEASSLHCSSESKLDLAKSLKLEGNQFYAQKKFKEAIRQYHKAVLYIKAVENDAMKPTYNPDALQVADTILEDTRKLKSDCYNNLSACLLQMPEPNYEKIIEYCDEVIKRSPNNDKALFRKAQALFKTRDFEGALSACLEVKKLLEVPDSKVMSLITQCQSQLAKQHSKEKVLYSSMLGFK